MRKTPLVVMFAIFPFLLQAQSTIPEFEDQVFSPGALSNVVNRRLNGLVSGQPNGTLIGNYAAFDPVAGSFTFKGTMAFDKHSDTLNITEDYFTKPAKVSFLSFKLQGDLVDGSYASLFSNSKLNTNAALELQYHFRIGKLPPIKIFGTEYLIAKAKKNAIMSELKGKNSLLDSNYLSLQKRYLETAINVLGDSMSIKQRELDSLLQLLGSSGRSNTDSVSKWKKKTDDLMTFLATTRTDLIQKNAQIDSLDNVLKSFSGYSIVAGSAYAKEATKKKWLIENSFSVVKLQFWWFTALAGGSRMDYYTYNSTAPFSNGVIKQNMNAWRLGLAFNFYSENNLSKFNFLFNSGFKLYKDNNTSKLSTTSIAQEVVTKNSSGDTTRKISKTYNAYTDKIDDMQAFELFSNFYLLKGTRRGAIHLYPSYQHYYHGGGNYLNSGIGYLMSFINTKKDQPVINIEGYVELQDITNYGKKDTDFWKRTEIGIRFAVPFNLF